MTKKIFTALTALILCFAVIFSSTVIPASAYVQPDASVESISIHEQSGVLEGEVLQLYANIESSSTLFDSVEWSSSNPQAISCTKDGKIEGLVAGKRATITCKAKYGSAKDSITVYCAKKLPQEVKSGFKKPIALIYSSPDSLIFKDVCIDFSSLRGPFSQFFLIFAKLGFKILPNALRVTFNQVTVCGKSGSYAYIRYGENNLLDGFVKNSSLKNTGNVFLTLSATDMDVWANGIAYDHRKLTTKYNGDVEWIYDEKSDYFTFDKKTGQVTGLIPGKNITITAKADGETATCTMHLLYKWEQAWTGKTNRKTNLYYAVGNGYSKGSTSLPTGTEFVVEGDCGTSNGWAYGYYQIGETKFWGYIPISHISTKGTVSQYNLMTTTTLDKNGKEIEIPWVWPVRNTKDNVPQTKKANFISSPYGWRDTNPKNHQGIDITTGKADEIAGYDVVPAFSGTVVFCGDEYGYDWGYCVAIRSDVVDPVSGLPYIAVYMHLMYAPKVSENQKVIAGKTILGYVGKTTTPKNQEKMGYHLHFEFNNQNSSIGLSGNSQIPGYGRKSFDYLVNPIFVYIDKYENGDITYNPTSEAELNYKKTFWYGNGDTYNEAS